MANVGYINQELKSFYSSTTKLTGAILKEYEQVCGHWTDEEFTAALSNYRAEDKKAEYCPTAHQLRKYGPARGDAKAKSMRLADTFFQLVELLGWSEAINNALCGNSGPEIKKYVIDTGMQKMGEYEAFGVNDQEYFVRLHKECDPISACAYMEDITKNNYKQYEFWRKRKEYYEALGLEAAQHRFPAIRWSS
jgi:hypothetical protein